MLENVLVLGSGGREHALCHKLSQSDKVAKLYCATGNAGISNIAVCVDIEITNPQEVLVFCQKNEISFVVIGSEAPAAAGVANVLRHHNIRVFGPSQQASQLESSKGFTKDICYKVNAPTARYVRCNTLDEAYLALKDFTAPYVIKADGLAAGKGVVIAQTFQEAEKALEFIFSGGFAQAGNQVVIEDFLEGEEVSFFILSDGETIIPFGTAQDHKRAFDGDTGANTGGMGAYSPASILTDKLQDDVIDTIISPILKEMKNQDMPFTGVLYAGLILTKEGPKLIEFNVRFGDPECQVLMQRLESDLFDILNAVATQNLAQLSPVKWSDDYAITVVMASKNYPDVPIKGDVISLPDSVEKSDFIFHAGTKLSNKQEFITNGGRVLNVTSKAKTLQQARDRAYKLIEKISWKNSFYRSDIGHRQIMRENKS